MKKKMSRLAILVLLVFVLSNFLSACGGNSSAVDSTGGNSTTDTTSDASPAGDTGDSKTNDGKVYSLSVSTHDPATSNKTKFHEEWARRIEEASGGRLDITVYSAGALSPGTAALDALRTGVCDIAWIYPPYFPGQFPLSDVVSLPIGIDSVPQATNVLWDLYESEAKLQEEVSEFIPLMIHSNPVNKMSTIGKHVVNSIDDVKGLKFRAAGGIVSDLLIAWGATPMQIAPGDIFQSVEKGTIDGYVFDYSGIKSFNLHEVTDNYMDMAVYLGPYYLMMNKNSFENLPEDLQKIIMDNSTREASLELAYIYESDELEGLQLCVDSGGNIVHITDDAKEKFAEAGKSVSDEWIKNNTTNDFDAAAYLEKARQLAEKYYISPEDLKTELGNRGLFN